MQQRLRSLPDEATRYAADHAPTSAGVRVHLWRRSLDLVAGSPVFGLGLKQWAPAYAQSIRLHGDSDAFRAGHPHQEFLLTLAEQGAAGLLVQLLLLTALARHIRRLDPPWRDMYLCVLAIYLIAGLGNCLWADYTHRHTFVLLVSCIPALMRRPMARAQ
jgi:O-antigen ligase